MNAEKPQTPDSAGMHLLLDARELLAIVTKSNLDTVIYRISVDGWQSIGPGMVLYHHHHIR